VRTRARHSGFELRRDVQEHYDYELLPGDVHCLLLQWHGSVGEPLERCLVQISEGWKVELFPVRFSVARATEAGTEPPEVEVTEGGSSSGHRLHSFLARDTLGFVEDKLLRGMGLGDRVAGLARLWLRLTDDPPPGSDGWVLLGDADREKMLEAVSEDMPRDGSGRLLPCQALVEWRQDPTKPFPREGVAGGEGGGSVEVGGADWRRGLKVGDMVDSLDSDRRWFDAMVIGTRGDEGGAPGDLQLHFMGWSSKWDVWVARESPDVLPLHCRTTNWRGAIAKGQLLEVADAAFGVKGRKWHLSAVLKTKKDDRGGRQALVKADHPDLAETWVDVGTESVCNPGTHTKKAQQLAASVSLGLSAAPVGGLARLGSRSSGSRKPLAVGSVGLMNLGNTCFMNSMLQCLAQARALSEMLLTDQHVPDINRTNPLGTGGLLVEAYADIVKKMFSGTVATVVPREFKGVLGRFAPQFAGYQQQDSQEFMSFLLDGIHEDLNRVYKKPYTEQVVGDGRKDEEVASETWRRHLLRNNSAVVDSCQGLLRSSLMCPICKHQNITFDPYMSLSLPLPGRNAAKGGPRKMAVTCVPLKGVPRFVEVSVASTGTIGDLRTAVLDLDHNVTGFSPNASPGKLRVCDIWQHRVYKAYRPAEKLTEVRKNDETFIYECRHAPPPPNRAPKTAPPAAKKGKKAGPLFEGVRFVEVLMGAAEEEGAASAADGGEEVDLDDEEPAEWSSGKGNKVADKKPSAAAVASAALSPAGGVVMPCRLVGAPWSLSYDAGTTCGEVRLAISEACDLSVEGDRKGRAKGLYQLVGCNDEGDECTLDLTESSGTGDSANFAEWLEASAAMAARYAASGKGVGRLSARKGTPPQGSSLAAVAQTRSLAIVWSREGFDKLTPEAEGGWRPLAMRGGVNGSRPPPVEKVPLAECFKMFTEREQLGGEDKWFCPKCKVGEWKRWPLMVELIRCSVQARSKNTYVVGCSVLRVCSLHRKT